MSNILFNLIINPATKFEVLFSIIKSDISASVPNFLSKLDVTQTGSSINLFFNPSNTFSYSSLNSIFSFPKSLYIIVFPFLHSLLQIPYCYGTFGH